MLPGARFSDKASLAHPLGQQRLTEHIIDLVGSRVVEIFALEEHPYAQLFTEPKTLGKHRRAAGIVAQDRVELGPKRRVCPCLTKSSFELLAGRHERLGHEPPTELTESARIRGLGHQRFGIDLGGRIDVGHVSVIAS